jgi:hypothetical protein
MSNYKMSEIGNIMRSASNELNNYILSKNARLAKTADPLSETPPDYHDQETCHQLQFEAGNVDKLTARVAELESKTKWLCPDSNPPEKDFEVITCSDDDVGLSTYRENQDGSHYFDGMANVSGWMPKPEVLEDKS